MRQSTADVHLAAPARELPPPTSRALRKGRFAKVPTGVDQLPGHTVHVASEEFAAAYPPASSKSELVVRAVREMIVAGQLLPGAALRQQELAARFGVSATPVREAIRCLEAEGLVRCLVHRGATVASPDAMHLEESLRILAVLEALAGRLAVERISAIDLREIEDLAEEMKLCRHDERRRKEVNRLFHFRVYECAGSPMLLAIMRLLWSSFPGGPHLGRPFDESVRGHASLIAALRRRDPGDVAGAIDEHVTGMIDYVQEGALPIDGR
ncbi:MAG TPA: GntR family transcriptional regulator [Candidatus Saccharimonadales bacterium]|nr:GntR family transcriptional regulator [Candidatus Saccharimonadales bacterium]